MVKFQIETARSSTIFKALAQETGVPYQNLINLYLTECAHSGKKLTLQRAS